MGFGGGAVNSNHWSISKGRHKGTQLALAGVAVLWILFDWTMALLEVRCTLRVVLRVVVADTERQGKKIATDKNNKKMIHKGSLGFGACSCRVYLGLGLEE